MRQQLAGLGVTGFPRSGIQSEGSPAVASEPLLRSVLHHPILIPHSWELLEAAQSVWPCCLIAIAPLRITLSYGVLHAPRRARWATRSWQRCPHLNGLQLAPLAISAVHLRRRGRARPAEGRHQAGGCCLDGLRQHGEPSQSLAQPALGVLIFCPSSLAASAFPEEGPSPVSSQLLHYHRPMHEALVRPPHRLTLWSPSLASRMRGRWLRPSTRPTSRWDQSTRGWDMRPEP